MEKNDYKKEEIRGSIKEIMRTRGLRSISIANYYKWKNNTKQNEGWLHSIKLNIEDGYLYLYSFSNGTQAGEKYKTVTLNMYNSAYKTVKDILNDEESIPCKVRRNILVKIAR